MMQLARFVLASALGWLAGMLIVPFAAATPNDGTERLDHAQKWSVVSFCDHGNRVYHKNNGTGGATLAVVPYDAECLGEIKINITSRCHGTHLIVIETVRGTFAVVPNATECREGGRT